MVLIGLGSNQGDSMQLVHQSMQALQRFARGALLPSSLWRTSPVDCPEGAGSFINAVVGFEPSRELTPLLLLKQLKQMERENGRHATLVRNAPRELDLDLLVFDEVCMASADLTLPHPRAAERLFVLAPALEVAPDLIWPGLGKTVRELYQALNSDESVHKLDTI